MLFFFLYKFNINKEEIRNKETRQTFNEIKWGSWLESTINLKTCT